MQLMTDESWQRHANPWSVWTRFAAIPLAALAIWSRVWIGWWCLVPVALVVAWLILNVMVFAPVREPRSWASKGIYGERLWAQNQAALPRRDVVLQRGLILAGLVGMCLFALGLVYLHLLLCLVGMAALVLAQLWRIDQFRKLYERHTRTAEGGATMRRITPFLWFDGQAEPAAKFYVSLFPDSRVERVTRAPVDTPSGPAGTVLTVEFTLAGTRFIALNGGPHFRFNEAVSFQIDCADQAEVDRLWSALSAGGSVGQCGWLKDRWGLSWQVTPARLHELLADADPARAGRAMRAMLTMSKIVIAELERAADGG